MKKGLFACILIVSLFQFSCSDDDSSEPQENTAPDVAELAISNESGLSVDLTWNEVVDPDGDVVTYDLFANGEIVEADLTTVDFIWTAEGRDDVTYPILFTVVSKDDNGGGSVSNEVELDDPIIGKWELTSSLVLDEITGEVIEDLTITTDCFSEFYVEFASDGSYVFVVFSEENGICTEDDELDAIWENLGNEEYFFEFISIDDDSASTSQTNFEEDRVIFTSSESICVYTKI